MADGLAALIRLARHDVDDRRRHLGQLLRRGESLAEAAAQLSAEMERERRVVQDAASDTIGRYDTYLHRALARRRRVAEETAALDAAVAETRDGLAACYRRLRSLEMAAAARQQRRAAALAHRERLALDEIGIAGYRRRGSVPT